MKKFGGKFKFGWRLLLIASILVGVKGQLGNFGFGSIPDLAPMKMPDIAHRLALENLNLQSPMKSIPDLHMKIPEIAQAPKLIEKTLPGLDFKLKTLDGMPMGGLPLALQGKFNFPKFLNPAKDINMIKTIGFTKEFAPSFINIPSLPGFLKFPGMTSLGWNSLPFNFAGVFGKKDLVGDITGKLGSMVKSDSHKNFNIKSGGPHERRNETKEWSTADKEKTSKVIYMDRGKNVTVISEDKKDHHKTVFQSFRLNGTDGKVVSRFKSVITF